MTSDHPYLVEVVLRTCRENYLHHIFKDISFHKHYFFAVQVGKYLH